jgi:hypothetical protein
MTIRNISITNLAGKFGRRDEVVDVGTDGKIILKWT